MYLSISKNNQLMKIEIRENTALLNQIDGDLALVVHHINDNYKSLRENNIILDLRSLHNVSVDYLNSFKTISEHHRKNKKSFIIVADTDFNDASDDLMVVPTILEAHDIIEMEEIERDLGF